MRLKERNNGLLKAPRLVWDALGRGRYDFIYDQMPVHIDAMPLQKRLNLVKAGMNMLFRRPVPWSMPLHMQFELTNYCNLKCPVCPTGIGAVRRTKQNMDIALFRKALTEVGPYLLTLSLWGWGEPLLHPQIKEILKICSAYDIATLLSTNGQNLGSDRVIDALTTHPPTYLICAIDGLTNETNRQFRQGSRLEATLSGVHRIADIKRRSGMQLPVLHMRFIVMKHNQHEVPRLLDFSRQHQFDLLTIRTLSIIDVDAPDRTHCHFIPDDQHLRAYQYSNGQRIAKRDFICFEPFWFPTLFTDGTVVACEQDYNAQLEMGKIQDQFSFNDVWRSRKAKAVRRLIRDYPAKVRFCRNCPYRDRETTDVSVKAHFLNPGIDYGKLLHRQARC